MSLYPLDRSVPNAKKVWTKEEEEYLSEKWGTASLKSIAKKLGRSENAVIVRIQRLGLGPGLQNGVRISWNTFVKTLLGGEHLRRLLQEAPGGSRIPHALADCAREERSEIHHGGHRGILGIC